MQEINFGAGRPDPGSFPKEALAKAAEKIILDHGTELVNYPDGRGYEPLRAIAAQRFERNEGCSVPINEIVLTSGSMQALQLISETFASPGDTIITEEVSYGGSLSVFRKHRLQIVPAPIDEQGLVTDRLEGLLKNLKSKGTPPKFIYTIPTHHNPTGSILPLNRRKHLIKLAQQYDTIIIDDHCYGDIVFQPEPLPANLYHLSKNDRVIYVGSFSKILGPGVRQGYLIAPDSLQQHILANKIDGGTNALSSMIVAQFLGGNMWGHIRKINGIMEARKNAVIESLALHFSGFGGEVSWTDPPGGMFVWVQIPRTTDTKTPLQLAAERGVYYTPGQAFSATGRDIPFLRIAFGFPTIDHNRDGIPILAECIKKAQDGNKHLAA